jgi:hypothetical protein
MFQFLTLVTRVPRPAELIVTAAAGIVFTISGRFPQTAKVREPHAGALSGPSNNLKDVGVLLSGHPLPPLESGDQCRLLHPIDLPPFLDQLGRSPKICYFVTKSHFEKVILSCCHWRALRLHRLAAL